MPLPKKTSFVGFFASPAQAAEIRARAVEVKAANRSEYLRGLAEADLAHESTPSSVTPDILERLARTYAGYMAPDLARNLAHVCEKFRTSQPAILHRLLQMLADATEPGHAIDPEHMTITHDAALSSHYPKPTPAHALAAKHGAPDKPAH